MRFNGHNRYWFSFFYSLEKINFENDEQNIIFHKSRNINKNNETSYCRKTYWAWLSRQIIRNGRVLLSVRSGFVQTNILFRQKSWIQQSDNATPSFFLSTKFFPSSWGKPCLFRSDQLSASAHRHSHCPIKLKGRHTTYRKFS